MFETLSKITQERIDSYQLSPRSTDRGGAQLLFNCLKGFVKFNHSRDQWLIYNTVCWIYDRTSKINEIMLNVGNQYRKVAMKDFDKIDFALISQVSKWENVNTASKVLKSLSTMKDIAVTEDELDNNPYLFCLQNGTYNFATMEFQENNQADLITICADYVYEKGSEPSKWLKFLNKIFNYDEQLITFIQIFIGVSLTGISSFDKLLFFYGSGKNGKSVLIQVLTMLLGRYAVKIPARVVQTEKFTNYGQIQNEIARLKGTRLAIAAETEEELKLSEATVKDLTGNDVLVGNYKYKDSFEFQPTHKLLMYGNHKPLVKGSDDGIWRRIAVVPFNVTISNEEQVPSDVLLKDFQKELPSIFCWAINGFRKWKDWDKKLPDSITSEINDYKFDSDHVLNFLDENVIEKTDAEIKHDDLYTFYLGWCKNNDYVPKYKRSITKYLKDRNWISRQAGGRKTVWLNKSFKETIF